MRGRCFTLCLVTLLSLNFSDAIANNNAGSATLQTSVSFRPEPLEIDASKEESVSGIDQEASPSNHATSSSSFALLSNGNTGSSSNLGPTYSNHQRNEEKPGSLGYSQGYILTSADPPLRATTYGPPSPVGMKYRMRRPNNPHYTTNIQHRFRGNVFPPKHLSDPIPYKLNPDPIPYKLNPSVTETPIHKFPVQHDVSTYRKFYKKPPEVPVVRKSVVKSKSPYYSEVYSKDGYEENFSTSSNFDDDFNKPPIFQEFSGEEQDRPLKPESDSDGFSKTFYDNFFTKPQGNKEPQRVIYYNPAKPAPPPARNLSKFYKKPISPYLPKHHSSLSSEYKSPGQIFSEPIEYVRPNQHKSSSSSAITSSALSASASSTSGEWTPINAPQGAVPAKSYDIPAPDLSTDRRSHIKRGVYEDSLRHDVVVGTNKFNKAGNSEEIVSAVVMVKQ